jgi:hypothetical protein
VVEILPIGEAWLVSPVIPGLRRQKQEHPEFKASLSYTMRLCLKTKQNNNKPKAEDVAQW